MGLGAAFAKGVQIAKDEQERKRILAQQEDERARRNALQDEDRNVSRQVQGRNLALQDLEAMRGQRAPVEELGPGIQGPPQSFRDAVLIPGIRGGGINIPERKAEPQYMEDVLAQARAADDLKRAAWMDEFRQKKELEDALSAVGLGPGSAAKLGLDPAKGKYDPKEISTALALKTLETQDATKRELASERSADRAAAAAEKKTLRQEAVSAYVQALQDGSATKEDVPVAIRGEVTQAAQKAGVRPLARKEHEQIQAFQSFENQAAQIRDSFDSGAVGPLEGRLPDFLTGTETASFRASVAGMFNELGKLRSGGAITPQEYERLRKELPDVADTETVFKAKLDRFMSSLALKRASIMEPVNREGFKPSSSSAIPLGGGRGGGNSVPLGGRSGAPSDPGGLF